MKRHHKQKNNLDGNNSSTDVSTEDLYIAPPITPVVSLVKSRSLESLKDALKDHEQYKEEVKVRHFYYIILRYFKSDNYFIIRVKIFFSHKTSIKTKGLYLFFLKEKFVASFNDSLEN